MLSNFEEQLLKNHVKWFKEASHEEREAYIDSRVKDLNPEARRLYENICKRLKSRSKSNRGV